MPDQDPYAEMLGEGGAGGVLGSVQRFAKRYVAQESGAALHAADERQNMRIQEGQRLHSDALNAAQYGMDEFFTPERVKYAKSLGVDLTGVQSVAQQRKQLMAQDENEFAQMSGGGQPATPAPAGGGATPGGVVEPVAATPNKGPMPPMNADDGKPNWHGHDWAAQAKNEPPEELGAYQKALFYMNKARHAEMFGLPTAKSYHGMAAFYGKQYHDMLTKRMGFESSSALESQRSDAEKERTQFVQNEEDNRARLSRELSKGKQTGDKLEAERARIAQSITNVGTMLASKDLHSPEAVKPIAQALNAQLDSLGTAYKTAGLDDPTKAMRVKLKQYAIPGMLYGSTPAATIEPEGAPDEGGEPAKPAAAAPAAVAGADPLEGATASAPGKPTLVRKGGKWVPVDAK